MSQRRAKHQTAPQAGPLPPGVLNTGTFPDTDRATRAALTWGMAAHEAGCQLSTLAVLINRSGDIGVNVTLAARKHWAWIARTLDEPLILEKLASPDAPDALRFLVAQQDGDSSFVLSLAELKEAAL